jgi:hypothetical protein
MTTTIDKAVLHILDTAAGLPVLSERFLALEDSAEFFEKHIDRLLEDSELKECAFEAGEDPMRELITNSATEDFIPSTRQMAESLFRIMSENVEIPSADVLFAIFRNDGHRFLGIVKFNYKEAFTHDLSYVEGSAATGVIRHKALYASDTQKIDECVLIDLGNGSIRIKEKKYEINGQKEYYLSNRFIRTAPARSYKEQYKLVERSAEQIVKKYYTGDSLKQAEVKMAIRNNVDKNMEIDIDDLSKDAFHDSPDMQTQYKQELSQKGLTEKKIKINKQIYNELERNHRLITDIGIKMEIPSDLMNDKSKLEFFVNQDGTMSILIKNVNEVKSR